MYIFYKDSQLPINFNVTPEIVMKENPTGLYILDINCKANHEIIIYNTLYDFIMSEW